MAYIGNTTQNQSFVPTVDYFSGNGSTTAFTLSHPVGSVYELEVVVNNVQQNPSSAYTVNGSTITFTSAPSSGSNNIYVYYVSPNTQIVQPGQGTVGATQVDGNYALWNKSGSDINYTAGNVGIGNTSPQFKLEVDQNNGAAAASKNAAIQVYTRGYGGSATYYGGIGFAMHEHANGYWGSGIQALDDTGSYGSALTFSTSTGSATPTPTERMRIDSSGRVTMPYQPAFFASPASNTGVSGSGVLTFGTVTTNIGNCYNASTGRFTAPVAGTYRFQTRITFFGTVGTYFGAYVYKNGSTSWQSYTSNYANGYTSTVADVIVYLAAGDYIQPGYDVVAACTVDAAGARSAFTGHLIG